MIVKRLVVGSLSANCWLVGSGETGEGLLIDPGGDAEDILRAIGDAKLDIKTIVLTHGHSDHIAALYDVQKETRARLLVHAEDAHVLRGQGSVSMMFGISYRTPAPPDRLLKEGDTVAAGDLSFSVLHTPGHTPGGICLLGHGAVFTGDTLFYHGTGTTMTFDSSRTQLLESIRSRLMVLPDETIVYPGHGRQTTIGEERKGNPPTRCR